MSLIEAHLPKQKNLFFPSILFFLVLFSSVNMDQQYVLRWNKHHENLSDGVISYFERGLMCDVTITVGPGQKLKVSV